MRLIINNDEAYRLARELATVTGETLTAAVIAVLHERLERIRHENGEGLAERLLAIGRDTAPRLKEPCRSEDHADLLYGDDGLPK